MPDNQQDSLFTELTDRESATVSGGSITSGIGGANSNSDTKNSSNGVNTLFFLPQPSQLYLYDPSRDRPYKTLVV
ncbi:secretion protein HlyD [Microcoleus sp. ARI1-B5]|uniref:secretion protein HlyD n=1 Tax=unclassified Microcoleus TaxID=2642155 RepID=UPI002FCE7120